MGYILAPQAPFPQGVLDDYQTEAPTPVCRIHLYYHLLILGYLLYISDPFEVSVNCAMANTILNFQLSDSLFTIL